MLVGVPDLMKRFPHLILVLSTIAPIGGCATDDEVVRDKKPEISEVLREVSCPPDKMAVCIEANCELRDYYCVDRSRMRDLLAPGRRQ